MTERRFKSFSPTSLAQFESNPTQFYLERMTPYKIGGMTQTPAMSLGSAVDARIKSELHRVLSKRNDPAYELKTLFDTQVDVINREWAWKHSEKVYNTYVETGAMADLLIDLNRSIIEPRFEFMLFKDLKIGNLEVPICGKPDCFAILDTDARLILDWKVNGYCSKNGAAPKKGYIKCRPGGGSHKDAVIETYKGMQINTYHNMEDIDKVWADQLSMYAWSLGEAYCTQYIVQIDQFACKPICFDYTMDDYVADIKCVSIRCLVGAEYQFKLVKRLKDAWEIVNSDWFFRDLSKDESIAKCKQLTEQAKQTYEMVNSGDFNDKYFLENVR